MEEKKRKLSQLPWQAIFDLAKEEGIEEEGLKSKTRAEIIDILLSQKDVSSEKIRKLLDDYIYGDRVTFTLWSFNKEVKEQQIENLKNMENTDNNLFVGMNGYRNFHVLSVRRESDRFEIVYTYSKEYFYLNEDGKDSNIWEMHRGCVWVGINKHYLACISKHESITRLVTNFVASAMGNSVTQIKPPKSAVEKCTNIRAKSRVTIQEYSGAKTTFACSTGLTDDQKNEEERLRTKETTFDTSGNYIAEISEGIVGTIKHNIHKGSIGIYKHLPADVLFAWTANAIAVIFNEIDGLKGKPISEIFESVGLQLKWNLTLAQQTIANWIMTQIVASTDGEQVQIPMISNASCLLDDEKYFFKVPRIYCSKCEAYEVPICNNCGKALKLIGDNLHCDCGGPIDITCQEGHKDYDIVPWYIPTKKLKSEIRRNLIMLFPGMEDDVAIIILGKNLIIKRGLIPDDKVEIQFSDIKEFQVKNKNAAQNRKILEYAVKLKEKCDSTCSYKKIEECKRDKSMVCLPKLFMGYLPGFCVQPHKGSEFGDIHGQVSVGNKHYMMMGIIKKNTHNNGKKLTDDMILQPLLVTSKEGEEIIRQFVIQGMQDSRAQLIAVVAPQHFDQNVQATIDYLAGLCNKKVVFIGLDQICQLISESDYIEY